MSVFKKGDRVEYEDRAHGFVGTVVRADGAAGCVIVQWPDGKRDRELIRLLKHAAPAKPRVYLAGPMRGMPEFNFPAFDHAAKELEARGWDVFNPAAHDREGGFDATGMTGHEDLAATGFDLRAALAADLAFVTEKAAAVAVLHGWRGSSGARAEVATAHALGLPVANWWEFDFDSTLPDDVHRIKPDTPPSGTIKHDQGGLFGAGSNLVTNKTGTDIHVEVWNKQRVKAGDRIGTIGQSGHTGMINGKPPHIECQTDSLAGLRRARAKLRRDVATSLGFDGAPHDELLANLDAMSDQLTPTPETSDCGGLITHQTPHLGVNLDAGGPVYPLPAKRQVGYLPRRDRPANPASGVTTGEVRTTSSTGGQKGVKPEMHSLIPIEALATVARHYGIGAAKYAKNQWRQGYEWSKSFDALQRHAQAFWGGEDIDAETQSPHMAAVAFHALTLLTFMAEHPNHDDRYKKEAS